MNTFFRILSIALCLFGFFLGFSLLAKPLDCPPSSHVTNRSPTCKSDVDCRGAKCCTNIFGTKSCLQSHESKYNKKNNGYKDKYNGYKEKSNRYKDKYSGYKDKCDNNMNDEPVGYWKN